MPNQPSKTRKGQHFMMEGKTVEQLQQLAQSCGWSKGKLLEYLIDQEHAKRAQLGQLGQTPAPFLEPKPVRNVAARLARGSNPSALYN